RSTSRHKKRFKNNVASRSPKNPSRESTIMPLQFQERNDGYRVTRADGTMVASLETRTIIYNAPGTRQNDRGEQVLVPDNPNGATTTQPKPYAECTIHSAGGALSVADIEEMLAHLKATNKEK